MWNWKNDKVAEKLIDGKLKLEIKVVREGAELRMKKGPENLLLGEFKSVDAAKAEVVEYWS